MLVVEIDDLPVQPLLVNVADLQQRLLDIFVPDVVAHIGQEVYLVQVEILARGSAQGMLQDFKKMLDFWERVGDLKLSQLLHFDGISVELVIGLFELIEGFDDFDLP